MCMTSRSIVHETPSVWYYLIPAMYSPSGKLMQHYQALWLCYEYHILWSVVDYHEGSIHFLYSYPSTILCTGVHMCMCVFPNDIVYLHLPKLAVLCIVFMLVCRCIAYLYPWHSSFQDLYMYWNNSHHSSPINDLPPPPKYWMSFVHGSMYYMWSLLLYHTSFLFWCDIITCPIQAFSLPG